MPDTVTPLNAVLGGASPTAEAVIPLQRVVILLIINKEVMVSSAPTIAEDYPDCLQDAAPPARRQEDHPAGCP
jgi:hypothetical protein